MKKSDSVEGLPIDRVQDVLEYFRSTGENWQSRMNAALRKAAKL